MEIERGRAGMQRANCSRAHYDWPGQTPRPTWLDMGIYWRQPHQSAPHLINGPEYCTDQEVYTSKLCLPSADRNCNRYPEENLYFCSLQRDTGCIASTWKSCALLRFLICNHKEHNLCRVDLTCHMLGLDKHKNDSSSLEERWSGRGVVKLTFCFCSSAGITEEKGGDRLI